MKLVTMEIKWEKTNPQTDIRLAQFSGPCHKDWGTVSHSYYLSDT